jgi:hypothetical protein
MTTLGARCFMKLNILKNLIILGAAAALTTAAGVNAEETQTQGRVAFDGFEPDARLVQPGTNTTIIAPEGAEGNKLEGDGGFLQLLFAPDFNFGKVKANYKENKTYDAKVIEAYFASPGTYITPFAQVADMTMDDYDWNLNLELASQFEADGVPLVGASLLLHPGNILSDVENYPWSGSSYPSSNALGNDGRNSESMTIFSHDPELNDAINGAKWSYVFGDTGTQGALDAPSVYETSGNWVAPLTTDSDQRTSCVQLEVPKEAHPKVGVEYKADLVWTLSSTLPPEEANENLTIAPVIVYEPRSAFSLNVILPEEANEIKIDGHLAEYFELDATTGEKGFLTIRSKEGEEAKFAEVAHPYTLDGDDKIFHYLTYKIEGEEYTIQYSFDPWLFGIRKDDNEFEITYDAKHLDLASIVGIEAAQRVAGATVGELNYTTANGDMTISVDGANNQVVIKFNNSNAFNIYKTTKKDALSFYYNGNTYVLPFTNPADEEGGEEDLPGRGGEHTWIGTQETVITSFERNSFSFVVPEEGAPAFENGVPDNVDGYNADHFDISYDEATVTFTISSKIGYAAEFEAIRLINEAHNLNWEIGGQNIWVSYAFDASFDIDTETIHTSEVGSVYEVSYDAKLLDLKDILGEGFNDTNVETTIDGVLSNEAEDFVINYHSEKNIVTITWTTEAAFNDFIAQNHTIEFKYNGVTYSMPINNQSIEPEGDPHIGILAHKEGDYYTNHYVLYDIVSGLTLADIPHFPTEATLMNATAGDFGERDFQLELDPVNNTAKIGTANRPIEEAFNSKEPCEIHFTWEGIDYTLIPPGPQTADGAGDLDIPTAYLTIIGEYDLDNDADDAFVYSVSEDIQLAQIPNFGQEPRFVDATIPSGKNTYSTDGDFRLRLNAAGNVATVYTVMGGAVSEVLKNDIDPEIHFIFEGKEYILIMGEKDFADETEDPGLDPGLDIGGESFGEINHYDGILNYAGENTGTVDFNVTVLNLTELFASESSVVQGEVMVDGTGPFEVDIYLQGVNKVTFTCEQESALYARLTDAQYAHVVTFEWNEESYLLAINPDKPIDPGYIPNGELKEEEDVELDDGDEIIPPKGGDDEGFPAVGPPIVVDVPRLVMLSGVDGEMTYAALGLTLSDRLLFSGHFDDDGFGGSIGGNSFEWDADGTGITIDFQNNTVSYKYTMPPEATTSLILDYLTEPTLATKYITITVGTSVLTLPISLEVIGGGVRDEDMIPGVDLDDEGFGGFDGGLGGDESASIPSAPGDESVYPTKNEIVAANRIGEIIDLGGLTNVAADKDGENVALNIKMPLASYIDYAGAEWSSDEKYLDTNNYLIDGDDEVLLAGVGTFGLQNSDIGWKIELPRKSDALVLDFWHHLQLFTEDGHFYEFKYFYYENGSGSGGTLINQDDWGVIFLDELTTYSAVP